MTAMSRSGYAWEKLHQAVSGLVTSTQPLPDRLRDAYVFNLIHIPEPRTGELPAEIKEDFLRLQEALRRVEGGEEGSAAASVALMPELEVREWLHLIVSMYERVAKYGPYGDRA